MKDIPLTCILSLCVCSLSKGVFLMCSFEQEETESSRCWDILRDIQPSGAAWVSVESPRVLMFTAQTEEHALTLAHLCSK